LKQPSLLLIVITQFIAIVQHKFSMKLIDLKKSHRNYFYHRRNEYCFKK